MSVGVLVSGGLHKWSGLGVAGALVSGARTVLGGWVLLGWAVGVLGGWGEVGCGGLQGDRWLSGIHAWPVCRSPTVVMAWWWSWSAVGASVGQEVIMLGGSLVVIAGGLQMASPESA